MTTDLKLLVEQKSGKNTFIERKYKNPHGSLHVEKHYVQVLLYYGILQYNFQLSPKNAHIQLLYSKYPLPDGLLEVEPLQKLIREAIRFRNQAVATEFWMAENGFNRMLPLFTPQTLNVEKQNDNFYNRYLLPQLTETLAPLHQLNDLERVTQRAYGMIAYLGMGEGLPNLSYYSNQEQFTKPYSEETARRIDHEVQQLINAQYERAKQLLRDNAAKHNELADLLCEHEVIFAADVENIFGPRPWKSRADVILEESPEEAEKLAVLTTEETSDHTHSTNSAPSLNEPNTPSGDTEDTSESLSYQAPTPQEQQ